MSDEKSNLFEIDWSHRLDKYVRAFTDDQIDKIVGHLKEWNTNARHCYTCQVLISALIRVVRADKLAKHRVVLEALPGLLTYTERHFQRLDKLHQASYMLEYFSSLIGLLPPTTTSSSEDAVALQRQLYAAGGGDTSHTVTAARSSSGYSDKEENTIPVLFKHNAMYGEEDEESEDDDDNSIDREVPVTAVEAIVVEKNNKKRKAVKDNEVKTRKLAKTKRL